MAETAAQMPGSVDISSQYPTASGIENGQAYQSMPDGTKKILGPVRGLDSDQQGDQPPTGFVEKPVSAQNLAGKTVGGDQPPAGFTEKPVSTLVSSAADSLIPEYLRNDPAFQNMSLEQRKEILARHGRSTVGKNLTAGLSHEEAQRVHSDSIRDTVADFFENVRDGAAGSFAGGVEGAAKLASSGLRKLGADKLADEISSTSGTGLLDNLASGDEHARGVGGATGAAAENVLEFFAGDEALKLLGEGVGFTKLLGKTKLAEQVLSWAKANPLKAIALNSAINGLRQGAVSGTQSLVHGAGVKAAAWNALTTAGLGSLFSSFGYMSQSASPLLRTAARVGNIAVGGGLTAESLHDALSPRQEGESEQDALNRQVNAAAGVVMGADALGQVARPNRPEVSITPRAEGPQNLPPGFPPPPEFSGPIRALSTLYREFVGAKPYDELLQRFENHAAEVMEFVRNQNNPNYRGPKYTPEQIEQVDRVQDEINKAKENNETAMRDWNAKLKAEQDRMHTEGISQAARDAWADAKASGKQIVESTVGRATRQAVGQLVTLGKAPTFVDSMLRSANFTAKGFEAQQAAVRDAAPELQAVALENPKAQTPGQFADAIYDWLNQREQVMLQASGGTKDSDAPVSPTLEKDVRQRLDKFFDDNRGKYGNDEQVQAAKDKIINRLLLQSKEAGAPPSLRMPNAFETENIRQGLNQEVKPQLNGEPTTAAYKVAVQQTLPILREALNSFYHDNGIRNVQEFRSKEATMITVAERLEAAEKRAQEMGNGGIWNALVKKFSVPSIITAIALGHNPLAFGALAPYLMGDRVYQNYKNPGVNIRRAIELAKPEPITDISALPRTVQGGPSNAPAEVEAPAPSASSVPVVGPSGVAHTTTPISPEKAGQAAAAVAAATMPEEPTNHALNAELAGHFGEGLHDRPLDDRIAHIKSITDAMNRSGIDSSKTNAGKMHALIRAHEAEHAAKIEAEQQKAHEDASKVVQELHDEFQKLQEENRKKIAEGGQQPQQAAAAFALPYETTDEELPESKFGDKSYSGFNTRVHELGHMIWSHMMGLQPFDVISAAHEESGGAHAVARTDISRLLNPDGSNNKEAFKANLGDLVSRFLAGAVAEDVHGGVPLDKNTSAQTDIKQTKKVFDALEVPEADRKRIVQQAVAQLRETFSKPEVAEIMKSFASKRKAGLGPEYHFDETQVHQLRQALDATKGEPDGTKETGPGVDRTARKQGGSVGEKPVARGERGGAPEPGRLNQAPAGLVERTTGDEDFDAAIRNGGGIPAGFMNVPGHGDYRMFHDPETRSTLAFKPHEAITPQTVGKKLAASRAEFEAGKLRQQAEEGEPEIEHSRRGGIAIKTPEAVAAEAAEQAKTAYKRRPLELEQSEEQEPLKKLKEKFGTTSNPLDAGMIFPKGEMVPLKGTHGDMLLQAGLAGKSGYAKDIPKELVNFLDQQQVIRTRYRSTRGGPEVVFSVPKQGVTPEQVKQIKSAVAKIGREGNVVMERTDVSAENRLYTKKEFPRVMDVDDMLRQIKAIPDVELQPRQSAPAPFVAEGADEYNKKFGRPAIDATVKPHSPEFAKRVADAYDAMKHAPNDPAVKKSYESMANEVRKQWDYATKELGVKFEPWTKEGQPYANSKEMVNDVRDNKHLYFFQGGDIKPESPMAQVDPKTGLSYNDMFRAVHDLFGHAAHGFEFGPKGEENAYLVHRQMFPAEAIPALTSETRGQNSWVNFGKHLRNAEGNVAKKGEPGYVPPTERPYAEQKVGLLPEEFHGKGPEPEGSKISKLAKAAEKDPVNKAQEFLKDEKGEPMVFYHGSPTKGIEKVEFRPGKNSTIFGSEPTERSGLFVTPDQDFAKEFAGKKGEVTAHNLNIVKPADLREGISADFYNEMEQHGLNPKWLLGTQEPWEMFDGDSGKAFVKALKSAGYDGAIINEPNAEGKNTTSYIAFSPEQISKVKPKGDWAAGVEKAPFGGVNPNNPEAPSKKYGFEIAPEHRHNPEALTAAEARAYAERPDVKAALAAHPDVKLGWDTTTQGPELNIGASTDDLATAKKIAGKLDQRAIVNTSTGEEIPAGGEGKRTSFPEYPLEDRLTDLNAGKLQKRAEAKEYDDSPEGFKHISPQVLQHLEPDEQAFIKDNKTAQRNIQEAYDNIKPTIDETKAAIQAGSALGGWWRRYIDTFNALGEHTNEEVAAKLGPKHSDALKVWHAAVSGNKSVENANKIAWGSYADWLDQGMPRDRDAINRILVNNGAVTDVHFPKSSKKAGQVKKEGLDTTKVFRLVNSPEMKQINPSPWHGNVFDPKAPSPIYGVTTGARKIPSMGATVAGEGNLNRLVLDTHMLDYFGERKWTDNKYLAFSAHLRQAARELGLQPGEGQEQIWGTVLGIKQLLYEGLPDSEIPDELTNNVIERIGKDYAQIIKDDPELNDIFERLKAHGIDPGGARAQSRLAAILEGKQPREKAPTDQTRLEQSAARIRANLKDVPPPENTLRFNFGQNALKVK